MTQLRVLDLFSGIGGFSLGLERAGLRTVAFCEPHPYCRRVLARHWPEVPIYDDVRELSARRLAADGIAPDLVCGGFPCQDISVAGRGDGLDGQRSGLWREMVRLVGELRPGYVFMENTAALLGRGLGTILGELAALGYDAEWHCVQAADVGAPHLRDRLWLVAYPNGDPLRLEPGRVPGPGGTGPAVARIDGPQGAVAHAYGEGLPLPEREAVLSPRRWSAGRAASERGWWAVEPDVGRVAHGVPKRVDRLRALGNAVVPQVVEIIGRAIVAHHLGQDP